MSKLNILDTIEETIRQAKERRQNAQSLETLQALRDQEPDLFNDQNNGEAKHLAKTAQNVTDAMHTSLKAELVELHSFIPKDLLPSVFEIALIAQAAYKEQRTMTGYDLFINKDTGVEQWKKTSTRKTVLDPITTLQNEMLVQEMLENARILMRELAALNGFRAIQGEHNIGSLVSGVNNQLTGGGFGLGIPPQQKGLVRRMINAVTGSK